MLLLLLTRLAGRQLLLLPLPLLPIDVVDDCCVTSKGGWVMGYWLCVVAASGLARRGYDSSPGLQRQQHRRHC
jgi:hypothetical protein